MKNIDGIMMAPIMVVAFLLRIENSDRMTTTEKKSYLITSATNRFGKSSMTSINTKKNRVFDKKLTLKFWATAPKLKNAMVITVSTYKINIRFSYSTKNKIKMANRKKYNVIKNKFEFSPLG